MSDELDWDELSGPPDDRDDGDEDDGPSRPWTLLDFLLLAGAIAGLGSLVYLIVKATQGVSGSNNVVISNSTVTLGAGGGQVPSLASFSSLRPDPSSSQSTLGEISDILDSDRAHYASPRNPRSLLPAASSPVSRSADVPTRHTSFNSVVVPTGTVRIISEMFSDASVLLSNASAANSVRVGRRDVVAAGGGMYVPPGQVIPFVLRANTDLWAAASAATNLGISIEDS
jgi:hypothetical protein